MKFDLMDKRFKAARSLPVRGAWIEMGEILNRDLQLDVAPRAGSVD